MYTANLGCSVVYAVLKYMYSCRMRLLGTCTSHEVTTVQALESTGKALKSTEQTREYGYHQMLNNLPYSCAVLCCTSIAAEVSVTVLTRYLFPKTIAIAPILLTSQSNAQAIEDWSTARVVVNCQCESSTAPLSQAHAPDSRLDYPSLYTSEN